MNYFFTELYRSFSLLQIHNDAVESGALDWYRKALTPFLILILILIVRGNYVWYIIFSPLIVLCAYYSFGEVDDLVDSDVFSELDEEIQIFEDTDDELVAVPTESVEEERSVRAEFIYGAIYSFFCLSYPDTRFIIDREGTEDDNLGYIKVKCAASKINIEISDNARRYQFDLEGDEFTNYDKEMLLSFFKHSKLSSFVITKESDLL